VIGQSSPSRRKRSGRPIDRTGIRNQTFVLGSAALNAAPELLQIKILQAIPFLVAKETWMKIIFWQIVDFQPCLSVAVIRGQGIQGR
jgi:hypothetical protein